MKNLRSTEQPVNEFDEMLLIGKVKKSAVAISGMVTFFFSNDMEITVWHCISSKIRMLR